MTQYSPPYTHILNGRALDLPVGKAVCVGRNYAAHIRELNNPTPSEPILFIKPNTALRPLQHPISFPTGRGACHFETELAILISQPLSNASTIECQRAIGGIGLALDLTLRDLQTSLKEQGLPWEKAKAFDGACPTSEFISFDGDLQNLPLKLWQNGELKQHGNSRNMLTPVTHLLAYSSKFFTLLPGDIVLTGTPEGVGPLHSGDTLQLELAGQLTIATSVA